MQPAPCPPGQVPRSGPGGLIYPARSQNAWMAAPGDDQENGSKPPMDASSSPVGFDALAHATQDALILVDGRGRIVAWNPGAEDLLGYPREEIVGQPVTSLVPEAQRESNTRRLEGFLETKTSGIVGNRVEVTGLHRDGSHVPLEVSVDAIEQAGDVLLALVARRPRDEGDVSRPLEREQGLTELLRDAAIAANEASDPRAATRRVLERVCQTADTPVGHAYVRGPGEDKLHPTDLWRIEDPDRFAMLRDRTMGTSFEPGEGLPGRALEDEQPVWEAGLLDPEHPRSAAARQLGVGSAFAFPVAIGDEVVAVLEFFREETDPPDPALLDALEPVGAQLGRAFERHRTRRKLKAREERFRILAEAADEAVFVVEDGRVVDVNQAAVEIFGRTRTDLIGRHPATLPVEEHASVVERKVDTCSEESYRCLIERGDGEHRWVHVNAGHVERRDMRVRITTIRDVTDLVGAPPTPEAARSWAPGEGTIDGADGTTDARGSPA